MAVLTSLLFIGVLQLTKGLDSCVDLEPCSDYHEHCVNPGIPHFCMKFCNACKLVDDHYECSEGYIERNNECRPCAEQGMNVLMTSRECPQNCPRGRWGSRCEQPCSANCMNGCERWSGHCLGGCKDGTYGAHCNLHCEDCNGRCYLDGVCARGCMAGLYGERCLQQRNSTWSLTFG